MTPRALRAPLALAPSRLFAALLLAVSITACEDSLAPPELNHVVIAVAGQTVVTLPLAIMEQKGFFTEEGLDVEIIHTGSSTDSRDALLSGTADVVMSNYEQLLQIREAQNTDAVSFVLFGNVPGPAFGVRTALAGTIKSAKDLGGRKVGISATGSLSHNLVRYLLRKEGVAESAVNFVVVGLGLAAEAAIETGQVDALASVDPAMTDLQNRGAIQILTDTRTLAGTRALYGGDFTGTTFFVRRSFLERYPVTTQRLTNASIKALRWMHDATPQQIAAVLSDEYVAGDRHLFEQILQNSPGMFSTDGRFAEATLNRVIGIASLFDPTIAGASIKVGDTYTNAFLDRVP
jgi:NitT/TauT family transport system substrate-binding protein